MPVVITDLTKKPFVVYYFVYTKLHWGCGLNRSRWIVLGLFWPFLKWAMLYYVIRKNCTKLKTYAKVSLYQSVITSIYDGSFPRGRFCYHSRYACVQKRMKIVQIERNLLECREPLIKRIREKKYFSGQIIKNLGCCALKYLLVFVRGI